MGGKPRVRTAADGIVVIDKPAGMTSHDVVARMRRVCGTRAVGHAGTLDPMATGVLIIGVERATKLLGHLTLASKTYDATIRLGETTTTDDAEGVVMTRTSAADVTDASIRTAAAAFAGVIAQRPSAVSAIKVDGVRSYARVRAGEDVELPARDVTIHEFTIHAMRHIGEVVDVDVTVRCSAGTYIRALARDLGAALGVGGHLTALRRTASGDYTIADAQPLPDVTGTVVITPLVDVLSREFAVVQLDAATAQQVRHGIRVPVVNPPTGLCGLLDEEGAVIALSEAANGVWKHAAVFA